MSTVSIAGVVAPTTGRHRLGHPGLVSVTAVGAVVRRGLLSWFRPGRHRWVASGTAARRSAPMPVPAAV